MALGAVEAIAARNLTGERRGRLLWQRRPPGLPGVMGRRAVEKAIQAAQGEPVEKQAIITPVLVTKENASQFLR